MKMDTIISLLKKFPYKIIDKNKISYYFVICKGYNSYIVRYWDFEHNIILRQQDKKLINVLKKTEIALDLLKETGEI